MFNLYQRYLTFHNLLSFVNPFTFGKRTFLKYQFSLYVGNVCLINHIVLLWIQPNISKNAMKILNKFQINSISNCEVQEERSCYNHIWWNYSIFCHALEWSEKQTILHCQNNSKIKYQNCRKKQIQYPSWWSPLVQDLLYIPIQFP